MGHAHAEKSGATLKPPCAAPPKSQTNAPPPSLTGPAFRLSDIPVRAPANLSASAATVQRFLNISGQRVSPQQVETAGKENGFPPERLATLKAYAEDQRDEPGRTYGSWAAAGTHVEMDRQALAHHKLAGRGTMEALQERLQALRGMTSIAVARGAYSPPSLVRGAWPPMEFPVTYLHSQTEAVFSDLPNDQRVDQMISYLVESGIDKAKIKKTVPSQNAALQMVAAKLEPALKALKGPIDLSIMPISTASPLTRSMRFQQLVNVQDLLVLFDKQEKTTHLIINIQWAHGELAEHIVDVLMAHKIKLDAVNLHGVCGSLTPALGRETMVVPRGTIYPIGPEANHPVRIPSNSADSDGAMLVSDHGHARNLLDETDDEVGRLADTGVHTIDMESYYLVKGLNKHDYDGDLKMIFAVSDVATSPHESMTNPAPQDAASFKRRQARDSKVRKDFFRA